MLKIYNSLIKKLEPFQPLHDNTVGLYTCGPTVYHFVHIGNLRTFVFEDILKRVLLYNGYKVNHIMNITDVGHLTDDADNGEDKMEAGARREGKNAWEVAKFYEAEFLKDIHALNILPANKFPRATDHIKEQIELIIALEKKGFTYKTTDGIYFDTSKFPNYGKMANLKNQSLKAGARVAMGEKKNPTDFALWKFRAAGEKRQMEWPSPWGIGFPGWHLECSAMAVKYLGQPFDIHCGGIDLIPVHHTNEIAQSQAAVDKPLANFWMHGEFLIIGQDKMSKSENNFITLQTLKDRGVNPLAYRYLLLQTHYRKPLTFSWDALQAAQNGLNHLSEIVRGWEESTIGCAEYEAKFLDCVNDDLNMPEALALVWAMIKDTNLPNTAKKKSILKFDEILGLDLNKAQSPADAIKPDTQKIIVARDIARQKKDFVESDRLRQELENLGYAVKDTKDGTKITKK